MTDALDRALADLVHDLNQPRTLDVEVVVTRVVRFATEALGVTDGSVYLAHRTSSGPLFESVVPTSPEVAKVDDLQHEVMQGPSIDSISTGDVVVCADLAADDRWPAWRESAMDLGFTGVISVRMHARERAIGALNLYSRSEHLMTSADVETVTQLAKHIAAVLAAALDQSTLNAALLSRSLIARAQGQLMERYGVDEEKAFGLLRRVSQHNNVKVREIAERLLAGERLDAIDLSPQRLDD